MRIFEALVALSFLTAAAVGVAVSAYGTTAPETKERLSDEEMETLVQEPMAVVRSVGLAAGEEAFERRLAEVRNRHGSSSADAADLLMAFGVALFVESKDDEDPALGRASLRYLKAAIPAYQAAFGADHPEAALALTSYADAEMDLLGGAPSLEAEEAREQAYEIRLRALGRGHPETRASLRSLAGVKGHPSRVNGSPDRLKAAVNSLESLLIDAPDEPFDIAAWFIRLKIARIYALNGRKAEAIEQINFAKAEANGRSDFTGCFVFSAELREVADILRQSGNDALADAIEPRDALAAILRCASEERPEAVASIQQTHPLSASPPSSR